MNKQPVRNMEADGLTDSQVTDYLLAEPEFFERNTGTLAKLQLPQQRDGAAISLMERQVLVLREKNRSMERKLHEFVENGRSNEAIIDRVHRLTRRLLRASDPAGVLTALETSLREDFGTSRWVLIVTEPSLQKLEDLGNPQVRTVLRDSPELKIFATFFESGRPRSGQIRDTQREYLFGGNDNRVGSTVLIPLGENASLGLLAIASSDTERYLPTMSTDFLVRIGEVFAEAIAARST
jgi:uncharacterized protein YigA (DUF484 family)